MSDRNIEMTPSDIVGAIQRGLSELNMYLQNPALAISVPDAKNHMIRMFEMLDALEGMQSAIQASRPANDGAEARAN